MRSNSVKTWICTICGHIHDGDEPPDFCPVCGAEKELFEPYSEAAPVSATKRWTCSVCGYIHDATEPPDICPVCGVTSEDFEPAEDATGAQIHGNQPERVVVIGAGVAGISAAESLHKASPQTRITSISNESHPPYYRLNLTRYLAGEVNAGQLVLHPQGWYAENGIDLMLNKKVEAVDLAKQVVVFEDEKRSPLTG